MRHRQWLRDRDVRVVLGVIGVVVFPAMLTLYTVQVPMAPSDLKANPTPLGYTVSLLIYLVPVLALQRWFSRRFDEGGGIFRRGARGVLGRTPALSPTASEYRLDYRRSAYRRTLLTLIPIGFLLDIVFGYAFLKFDNKQAVLGIRPFPAFSFADLSFRSHIPIEEFIFYTLGFMAILSVYVWCDEYWLRAYNVPDYDLAPSESGGGLPPFIAQVHVRTPLAVSVVVIGTAWLYKKLGPHEFHDGFPSYFTFLVLASVFPSILLFRTTRRFINWRAVSFTVSCVALTSLLWEATLAAPYGWWGYQRVHMLGLSVGAWYDLPIEAVLVWLSVSFTTVMIYETHKIILCMERVCGVDWRDALFGKQSVREWANEQFRTNATDSAVEHPEGVLAKEVAWKAGDRS